MSLRTGKLLMDCFKRSAQWRELQDEELVKLKKVMKTIMDDIVSVCDKNNLNYILFYGTALGAIRHKGYIPWDDDIDLAMPREDYEAFLKIAEKELGDKYYVRAASKGDPIAVPTCHVKLKGTKYVNYSDLVALENEPEYVKCIYVDIFPLDNASNIHFIRRIDGIISLLILFFISCVSVKDSVKIMQEKGVQLSKKEKKSFRVKVMLGNIFGIINKVRWYRLYDKFVKKNKNNDSKYVTCYVGGKTIERGTYLRDKILLTSYAEFEGTNYRISKDYDYYLKHTYGDWRVIPNKEHQDIHPIFELDFNDNQ